MGELKDRKFLYTGAGDNRVPFEEPDLPRPISIEKLEFKEYF